MPLCQLRHLTGLIVSPRALSFPSVNKGNGEGFGFSSFDIKKIKKKNKNQTSYKQAFPHVCARTYLLSSVFGCKDRQGCPLSGRLLQEGNAPNLPHLRQSGPPNNELSTTGRQWAAMNSCADDTHQGLPSEALLTLPLQKPLY